MITAKIVTGTLALTPQTEEEKQQIIQWIKDNKAEKKDIYVCGVIPNLQDLYK